MIIDLHIYMAMDYSKRNTVLARIQHGRKKKQSVKTKAKKAMINELLISPTYP